MSVLETFVWALTRAQAREIGTPTQNRFSRCFPFGRTTHHSGYGVSLRIRKRIEEPCGWIKIIAGQEKTKLPGCDRVGWAFAFAAVAYNLVRLPKLMAVAS